MTSATLPLPRAAPVDFLALTKPRIVVMVMATVAAGYLAVPLVLGSPPLAVRMFLLINLLIGTALVAAGTNALNQVSERDVDALMKRTADRPLPAGRMGVREAAVFAWLAGALGVVYLGAVVNWLTAGVAAATLLSYVAIYTPLKRRTTIATLVGAIPGALPIVGGWTAAGGAIDARVLALFWIMFLWQIPHFQALSWLYRDDYARAGLRMLSVDDDGGWATFRQAALYAVALLPISLAPAALGLAGPVYFVGALALSLAYVWAAMRAARAPSVAAARRLFGVSLVYLPALLALLVMDGVA